MIYLESSFRSNLRGILVRWRLRCFMKQLTFYDLLWVVSEEIAERGPLWPLQSIEKLLDLGGHPAAHRNSYKQDEGGEVPLQDKHTVTHTMARAHSDKTLSFKLLTISQSAAPHPIKCEMVTFLLRFNYLTWIDCNRFWEWKAAYRGGINTRKTRWELGWRLCFFGLG